MNLRSGQISTILITLLVSSCFPPPEFSDIPVIRYQNMVFRESASGSDSLILRFEVEDGNGDIGLGSDETYAPYHPYNIIIDSRDSVVTYGDTAVVPPFYSINPLNEVEFFSDTDTRPAYNCSDYQIAEFTDLGSDTFYIQVNEYHNNFYIDFLVKSGDAYKEIDWAEEYGGNDCAVVNFNGRIPIFDEENLGRSLSGTISYAMLSAGFPVILNNDTFKIRFYIYDRALNQSNVAESPDLTLPDITRLVD